MIENGILNIYKPAGMTSHDVVNIVRRVMGIRRVGHTGTLDPMATGVLPVCVGAAARITEYLDMDFKTYRCTLQLGKTTDTQDIWGQTIEERPAEQVTEEAVRKAFAPFRGLIDQKPPMYSAVRVNGRRLYEYAREGKEIEVKTRKVFIRRLEILSFDKETETVSFEVECSKGTYIRTICQDVGIALGCGAAMSSLERTASGRFEAKDAVDLDQLRGMSREQAAELMVSADFPLIHFGRITVDSQAAKSFTDGRHLSMKECIVEKEPEFRDKSSDIYIRPEYRRAYNVYRRQPQGNIFLGVAFYSDKYKKLVADKVFMTNAESLSL